MITLGISNNSIFFYVTLRTSVQREHRLKSVLPVIKINIQSMGDSLAFLTNNRLQQYIGSRIPP